jgi:hypothetical protein
LLSQYGFEEQGPNAKRKSSFFAWSNKVPPWEGGEKGLHEYWLYLMGEE